MARSLFAIICATLVLMWPLTLNAQTVDCRMGFYLKPNTRCFEETLALLANMQGPNPIADTYFAFLGEALRTYPDIKKHALNLNANERTKRLVVTSLRIAGFVIFAESDSSKIVSFKTLEVESC